jgi:hypothetical protein
MVGNRAPLPTITNPPNGTGFHVGDTISFAGSATDPEEGNLPASRLRWELTLIHTDHEHFITGFPGDHGSFEVDNHGEGTFTYRLTLVATDSHGLSASTTFAYPITPAAIPGQDFTVTATPAAATIGAGQSATFTVNVAPAAGSASFDTAVVLSCTAPASVTCSLSPTDVTPATGTATSTLTISTVARAGIVRISPLGVLAALLLLWAGMGKRYGSPRARLAAVALLIGTVATGCGGSRSSTPTPRQPQNVLVTVTGTSGSITHSTTIAVTIQ